VSNRFAYDRAGNRISHSSINPSIHSSSYRHTADNQLTGIYWNSSKVTLGGDIEQAWTTLWVRVQQSSTGFQPVTAALTCVRGQAVAWEARDVPVSGSGAIMFTVTVAAVKSTNTAAAGSILIWTNSTTVTYTKSSSGSGSIKYTCDNNGNRTYKWTNGVFEARYFYDINNQLVGISFNNDKDHSDAGDYTYDYDPFGRRIRAIEDTTNRYFIYDGLDCIAELDSTGGVTKTYVRGAGLGGGIGDIVAAWSMVDGQWLYFSYNHRGDVVTATRPDGNITNRFEYDAFGVPVTCNLSPVTRFIGFSSKEYDPKSGLSYYGFRYYDAQSGRWLTKDPIGWRGGVNLYSMTKNNPHNGNDLYGLLKWDQKSCCDLLTDKTKCKKYKLSVYVHVLQVYVNLTKRNTMKAKETRSCLVNKYIGDMGVHCFYDPTGKWGQAINAGRIDVNSALGPDSFGWSAVHELGHKCLGLFVTTDVDTWLNFPGHTLNFSTDYSDPLDFPIDPWIANTYRFPLYDVSDVNCPEL